MCHLFSEIFKKFVENPNSCLFFSLVKISNRFYYFISWSIIVEQAGSKGHNLIREHSLLGNDTHFKNNNDTQK